MEKETDCTVFVEIKFKAIEGFKNPDFLSFLSGEGATIYGK